MQQKVLHDPQTKMEVVGSVGAKREMHHLHGRLIKDIEPEKKKKKTHHVSKPLQKHKEKKQKFVHAVPIERAVPVRHYLQAIDLSPPQLAQVLQRATETRPHIQKAIVPPRVSKLHIPTSTVMQKKPLHIATDVQMQRQLKLQYDKKRSLTRDPSDLPQNRGKRQSLSRSVESGRKPIVHDRRVPNRSRTPSQARHDKRKPIRAHSSSRRSGTVDILGTSVSNRGVQRNLFRDDSGNKIGKHHSSAEHIPVRRNLRQSLTPEDRAVYDRMRTRDENSAVTFRNKLTKLNEDARRRENQRPRNFAMSDRLAGNDWLAAQRRINEKVKLVPQRLAEEQKKDKERRTRWDSQQRERVADSKKKEAKDKLERENKKANKLHEQRNQLTNRASNVSRKDLGFNFKTEFASTRLPQQKKKQVHDIRHHLNTLDKHVKRTEQKIKDAAQEQKKWAHDASFYKRENERRLSLSKARYSVEKDVPQVPLHKTKTAYPEAVTHDNKRARQHKWHNDQADKRRAAERLRQQVVAPVTNTDIQLARIDDAKRQRAHVEAERRRTELQEIRQTQRIASVANRRFRESEHRKLQAEKSRDQHLRRTQEATKEEKFQRMKYEQLHGPRKHLYGPERHKKLNRDKLGLTDPKTADENMRLNQAVAKKFSLSLQELSDMFNKTDLVYQRQRMKEQMGLHVPVHEAAVTPQRNIPKIRTQTVVKRQQNVRPIKKKLVTQVVTPPRPRTPEKKNVRSKSPVVQKPVIAKKIGDLNTEAKKLAKMGNQKLRELLLEREVSIGDNWNRFEMAKQLEKLGEKKNKL